MKIAGAQLPIVGRIPVEFQQNWMKTVGEEAHTNLCPLTARLTGATLYARRHFMAGA